ncbi:MAG: hypothetical protein IJZ27_05515 [Treponema sp.]|nr:hypothetical protein [Treponema sp.]
MKKLLKLITMLFLASAMVISCGGSGSGSGSDVPSTSDCTETVSTLKLSDGKWTVYVNQTSDYMAMEMKLEATVTNGDYEFTSGKGSATMNMEKELLEMGMPEDYIEEMKNMSDDEKNAFLFGGEIPEGNDVSWDGLTAKIKATASSKDLAEMEDFLDIEYMPDDAEIKTNDDRTKYTINFSYTDEYDGTTTNMEIKAIKK